jgi:hypothetical protein
MESKRNGFLMVTGIFMIIGGVLGLVFGIIAWLAAGMFAFAFGFDMMLTFATILPVISAIASLIAGIMGIIYAAKPSKATVCIIFGLLTAILSILGNVLTAAGGGEFSPVSLVTGLIFPVLYLIGAFQNKAKLRKI